MTIKIFRIKRLFCFKRKKQAKEDKKVFMDQPSLDILNRHFSPLPNQTASPSDVLDRVGYPIEPNRVLPNRAEQERRDEIDKLIKRIQEYKQEKILWMQKLADYKERENNLRKLIQENITRINELKGIRPEEYKYSSTYFLNKLDNEC